VKRLIKTVTFGLQKSMFRKKLSVLMPADCMYKCGQSSGYSEKYIYENRFIPHCIKSTAVLK